MSQLIITLIQSPIYWENKEKNLEMFSGKISAIKEKTDVVILPEMFSTGFTMNAETLAEEMNSTSVSWMRNESIKNNCVITGSLIIKEGGKFFNRLIWMRPDGFDYYDKRHLFGYAGENLVYTRGESKLIVTYKGWRIQLLICYDLRFPVWSRRSKKEDYDLLIYVANWPERRVNAWNQLLIARAIENQCFVAGVNRIGNDGNDIVHTGESVVIDCQGYLLPNINNNVEFVQSYILSKNRQEEFRNQFAFLQDGDTFEISI